MHVITKGVIIGVICGATIPAAVVAAIQFPEFFSHQYSALGTQELKILGIRITAATLRGQALLSTAIVGCIGGIIGAVIGLFFGIAIHRQKHRRQKH
jgi:ABC-type Fe3+ transport system permease subunit